MEIVNICTINFLNNTIRCVPEKVCCSDKPIWDSWYTWFGIGVLFFFLLTSCLAYLANACKKKQQNLIRIRNLSNSSEELNVITTITGPGGIIQPDIKHFAGHVRAEPSILPDSSSATEGRIKAYAKPLTPAYPPVEPVTIIKGPAPSEGYRQTDSYTDIVLPPGFIDSDANNKS